MREGKLKVDKRDGGISGVGCEILFVEKGNYVYNLFSYHSYYSYFFKYSIITLACLHSLVIIPIFVIF
jgi:hypothetical protein